MVGSHNGSVLVLNNSYEAINICNVQRALKLIVKGVAHSVEDSGAVVHSARAHYGVPAVIRLSRFVHIPHREVAFNRKNVLIRDGFRCQYCAGHERPEQLTIDHVVPISRGGRDTWDNVVACCRGCNHEKANRTPDESGMRLLRLPGRPRVPAFLFVARQQGLRKDNWRKYLFLDALAPVGAGSYAAQ